MREILFRGKRVDNGEWIYWDRYGRITDINGEPTKTEIDIPTLLPYPTYIADLPIINDETVGDYTGLTDKNGKKIFEGDIVSSNKRKTWIGRGKVWFGNGAFWCGEREWAKLLRMVCLEDEQAVVIGNVHDNPELLEVEK